MFFPFRGYGDPFRPAGAAYMPNILLLQSSNFHFTLMGRDYAWGGSFYVQYFAFSAKHFPFYAYGGAITPGGAAFMSSILHFQPSISHFTHMGARLRLRGRLLCPVFCFFDPSLLHSTGIGPLQV